MGIFGKLWKRRVFHVVGLYLGTAWAAVEVTSFLVGRYKLTDGLVDLVLIGLLLLVPAVAILAYNRFGRDEGDRLTAGEAWACVCNLALDLLVLWFAFGHFPVGRAVASVVVQDESGASSVREIPRADLLRTVVLFDFSTRDATAVPDWTSPALAIALVADLQQDRFLRPLRPILPTQIERLKVQAGGDHTRAPLTIRRKMADDFEAQYFVSGSLSRADKRLQAEAEVYQVQPAREVARIAVGGRDVFDLADALTVAIRPHLDLQATRASGADDLPVPELLTDSLEALAEFARSDNAIILNNDMAAALGHVRRAIELDPAFAVAGLNLALVTYLTGDEPAARRGLDVALRALHRLTEQQQLVVRAFDAELRRDFDGSERLLRLAVDLYPENAQARAMLAQQYLARGDRLKDALAQYESIWALGRGYDWALLQIGVLKRALGDTEGTAAAYREYQQLHRNDPKALYAIADERQRAGDFATAEQLLRDAVALTTDRGTAHVQLAQLLAEMGRLEEADAEFERAEASVSGPQERAIVLLTRSALARNSGRHTAAAAFHEESVKAFPELVWPQLRLTYRAETADRIESNDGLARLVDDIELAFPGQDDLASGMRIMLLWEAGMVSGDRPLLGRANAEIAALLQLMRRDDLQFLVATGAARLAYLSGDPAEAAQGFADALASTERRAGGANPVGRHRLLRWLLQAQRDARLFEAARATEQVIEREAPGSGRALLERAKLALAMDEPARARELATRAIDLWRLADPGFPHRLEAERLLASTVPDS